MAKSAGIIGAGLGGLSAALRLAANGFKVDLFEKNESPGGKMNLHKASGYRFDTGPSLLTMPFIIDELFHSIGLKRDQYLTFHEIDPICRYFWEDGVILDAYAQLDRMKQSIARISKEDSHQYRDFLLYSKNLYDLTADVFLYTPVHELRKLANKNTIRKLLRIREIDPFRTVHESISRYFTDDKIRQIFDRYATYNGSDPFQAPATLNIIPYVEYVLGSFYIEGGMYRLIETLVKLAEKLDIRIHTETPVQKILHRNKKTKGLLVENEELSFDYVVCNSDVITTFEDLIDGYNTKTKKLQKLEPSLSGVVFLWGINQISENLKHHNIYFTQAYSKEFSCLFTDMTIPEDPTVYIAITSKSDPSHAPEGKENWFVLCNMPHQNDKINWESAAQKVKQSILRKLKNCQMDVESKIEYEYIFTPDDFYKLYKSNKGSIYGISSNNKMTAFRRPANRSREIKGLYFATGSAHPGGGIPLTVLSGKHASDLILEREGIKH
jgi:phytoene desaturase